MKRKRSNLITNNNNNNMIMKEVVEMWYNFNIIVILVIIIKFRSYLYFNEFVYTLWNDFKNKESHQYLNLTLIKTTKL